MISYDMIYDVILVFRNVITVRLIYYEFKAHFTQFLLVVKLRENLE